MSGFEQWFRSLNANGKTVYFLGNEHKVSEMAWNHQQAKIDELQKHVDQLNQWNSNQYQLIKCNESDTQSLKHLLQKLIDDDYTTMRPSMAYEIQEAMRGEHE